MMECLRCHTENPPQVKFCLECASPLARSCTSCGTPALELSETPPFWARPAVPLGSHQPVWPSNP